MNASDNKNALSRHLIDLETAALQRWCNGDPSGFLELSAGDVSYFDPFQRHRIDGLAALTAFYEGLRGKVYARKFELVDPLVQPLGDAAAILSYHFISEGHDATLHRWHCTEAFRHDDENWKIVHTHWSPINAEND